MLVKGATSGSCITYGSHACTVIKCYIKGVESPGDICDVDGRKFSNIDNIEMETFIDIKGTFPMQEMIIYNTMHFLIGEKVRKIIEWFPGSILPRGFNLAIVELRDAITTPWPVVNSGSDDPSLKVGCG